ncbi:MAG TPA: AzlD domain-containing protein [Magnetospirillaceae bacterium]|nr:AzlD domain-containing protein [Magnetospirillaceae bacterium]
MDNLAASIAVMVAATVATRVLPFLIFRKREIPGFVPFLAEYGPPAILTILALYCFKDVDWTAAPHGAPELAAAALTAVLHLWRRSTLISIIGGTALYMALIQTF